MQNIVHAEIIDSTDLTEYANDAGVPFGEFPIEFVTDLYVADFDTNDRIAFVESDHLGVGGFFSGGQTAQDVADALSDCIENQSGDSLSEFVIPLNQKERKYLYIRIGAEY